MNSTKHIEDLIRENIMVKEAILANASLLGQIQESAEEMIDCLNRGNKILFCGNGGSFADAQHLAAELSCRFVSQRKALAAICLACNNSHLTAAANDFQFKQIFSREIEAIGLKGDMLIAISTSGMSENVLEAVKQAKQMGIRAIGLTAGAGGELGTLCDCICVPSTVTARIQEAHILIGHIWCQLFDEAFSFKA